MTVTTTTSSSASSSPSAQPNKELNIPHEFICPITQEFMKHPLMSRYGQTYERDAILTWLSKHNSLCPLTRQVLNVSDLIRHRSLQSRIEVWKKQNNMIESSSSSSSSKRYGKEADEDFSGRSDDDDEETPHILITCLKSDLLSYSDHNPRKQTQENNYKKKVAQRHSNNNKVV